MSESTQTRKLAAILAADVSGYSRLMADNEQATVQTLTEYRRVFADQTERHRGRVVDTAGDSVLATFDSPVEAVECAVDIQRELAHRNGLLPDDRRMAFRIGINLGDVILRDDGTVYGDGVNIAARLESLAQPGGITVSGTVFDHVENKLPVGFEFTGEHVVKNIAKPICAYRVEADIDPEPTRAKSHGSWSRRSALAAGVMALILIGTTSGWYLWHTNHWIADRKGQTEALGQPGVAIAVMPFENLSGDASQEFFADGVTDEIITALGRFQNLRVAARTNTFRYKGKTQDTRTVGNELRVRYVLIGSVRKSAETVRVSAQLLQVDSESQVWSQTYQRALTAKNVFEIQQELSSSIATAIGSRSGAVLLMESSQLQTKPPADLPAYECFMRWVAVYQRTLSGQDHAVVNCLERAVESDPGYSEVWAALADVYDDEYRWGYDPRPGNPLDRALRAAERAVQLNPQSQNAYKALATTQYYRGDRAAFLTAADRAIQLSPNEPNILAGLGIYMYYAGERSKGLEMVNRALALDRFPMDWYYVLGFWEHYRKGEYEAALVEAEKTNLPAFVWAHAARVAALGQLGRVEDARPHIRRILELDPSFETTAREKRRKMMPYDAPLVDHYLDGLRKAGMKIPEKSP